MAAAKKQQKTNRKAAKKQQKAMKKYEKAQRNDAKKEAKKTNRPAYSVSHLTADKWHQTSVSGQGGWAGAADGPPGT